MHETINADIFFWQTISKKHKCHISLNWIGVWMKDLLFSSSFFIMTSIFRLNEQKEAPFKAKVTLLARYGMGWFESFHTYQQIIWIPKAKKSICFDMVRNIIDLISGLSEFFQLYQSTQTFVYSKYTQSISIRNIVTRNTSEILMLFSRSTAGIF